MKKILIVDDEQDIRDLVKERLINNNYEISVAASGEEALSKIVSESPDLVLLDIAMPKMDGYSVCQEIRRNSKAKDTPVIFFSCKDLEMSGIIDRCKKIGNCGHISKLAPAEELLERIRQVIG